MISEEIPKTPDPSVMESNTSLSTRLCLADKDNFFISIMTSLTHTVTLQSSHLTDLVLLCTGPDGPLPVSVHSAVLSSQSSLLRDLLISVTDPVLVLPEVELNTVWCMLDLLYSGRCVASQQDRSKLVNLLSSLGLATVLDNLEIEVQNDQQCLQEHLGDTISENITTLGSTTFKLSPDLDCKVCGVKFHARQAVEFFFQERDCSRNNGKRLPLLSKEENCIYKEEQNSVSLSSSTDSLSFPPQCSVIYSGHTCQLCGKKARNPYKLREHYTIKHFFGEVQEMIKDKNNLSCQICGKCFEPGDNLISHMVRHIGATHKQVLSLVERECGTEDISFEQCQICDVKIDPGVRVFSNHLVEKHFKDKIKDFLPPDQSSCHICDKKIPDIDDLIIHVGSSHGLAIKFYEEFLKSNTTEATSFLQAECSATNIKSSTKKRKNISKACYICGVVIAGSGSSWKFTLYSHFSRRHFAKELVRDYETPDKKCSVCGFEAKSPSLLVTHLGVKHRLVEKYLDMKNLQQGQDTLVLNVSPPAVAVKEDVKHIKNRKQYKPRRLQLEVTDLAKKLMDQALVLTSQTYGPDSSYKQSDPNSTAMTQAQGASLTGFHSIKASKHENLKNDLLLGKHQGAMLIPSITTQPDTIVAQNNSRKMHRKLRSPSRIQHTTEQRQVKQKRNTRQLATSKPAGISCPFCEKKLAIRPVLQSHLLSRHFKKDCEEAIKQIFEKTGGVCPSCPGFRGSKPGTLDWSVFIHFSRKHKMAEDLEYSNNLLNQENVKKIFQRFFPE
eukprot:GFUD01038960.1.p1 GENE.GFUD01038960.1~~GFUD01038960.1.p1  ORF type:complete len:781 (+),score=171.04 GFUD01038960.1:51-2393(+)